MFSLLQRYKEEHDGNSEVPDRDKDNKNFYIWIRNKRGIYKTLAMGKVSSITE